MLYIYVYVYVYIYIYIYIYIYMYIYVYIYIYIYIYIHDNNWIVFKLIKYWKFVYLIIIFIIICTAALENNITISF